MPLELTTQEREFLLTVLDGRLGDLREEIHHSMVSRFTEELKQAEVLLKGIIAKVKAEGTDGTSD